MMTVILVLAGIIYLDARMLRRRDERLFNAVFAVSPRLIAIIGGLIIFHLALVEDSPGTLPQLIFIVLLPIYLWRRTHFLKSINGPAAPQAAVPRAQVIVADAYKVILIWFLAMIVIGSCVKSAGEIFKPLESELAQLLISAVFSSATALVLIARASQKFSDRGFRFNLGLRREGRPVFQVIVLPLIVGLAFAAISAAIMAWRPDDPATPLSEVLETADSSFLFVVFLIMAVLVAPLVEEIIFRGYFFYVLTQTQGERFAVCVISLIFAFLHVGQYWGDWAAIGMVFLLGFVLTILRAKTGTTLASIIAHYAYNAGVTIIPGYLSL